MRVTHRFTNVSKYLAWAICLFPAALPAQAQQSTKYGQGALYNNSSDSNENSAFGYMALAYTTIGNFNTAIGYAALEYNTTGYNNTASGAYALEYNTTGAGNTANGFDALGQNTTGYYNTATGTYALEENSQGSYNTADGCGALVFNTTGYSNTASGASALGSNTTGYQNSASGAYALYTNTTGSNDTASGYSALYYNTTGAGNTATGAYTLLSNTTGSYNAVNGAYGLFSNTTGNDNTISGYGALYSNTTGAGNTAAGYYTLFTNTTGSNNAALGYLAGYNLTTGSNNIEIGNQGASTDNGVIRIGTKGTHTSAFIAGISGVTAASGVAVYINANGQLGTLKSSRRFKNDIHDMGSLSAKLMSLRPVTFKYKDSAESGPHHLQYGLIAEEVAKVCPDLVQYDKAGKPFTVYYHLLTPMLLNELQKAHRQIDGQKTALTTLGAKLAAHDSEVAALKSELASLKQTQQQQLQMLARLNAALQGNGKPAAQAATFTR